MASNRKSRRSKWVTILGVVIAFFLFAAIFLGVVYFTVPDNILYESHSQGVTFQGLVYDQNGVPIKKTTLQTTVTPQGQSGVSGIFFMSFKLSASNVGNVPLTNLRYNSPLPVALSKALQNSQPLQPNLAIGQNNILLWDTANSCGSDLDCGTPEERCVATPQGSKCLIDISNFIGDINFQVTMLGDYQDLQGQGSSVQTTVALPINFQQDAVIFRTNSLSSAGYGSGSTEIVVDREGDGTMERYVFNSAGSESYVPADFIGWTVQNNLIYKCGTSSNICVSQATGLNKDSSLPSLSRWKYVLGGSAVPISNLPTEPYTSQNCGSIANQLCQERYSVLVSPPSQQCGDGLITGTEQCEATDLNGGTCATEGFAEGILYCSADCLSYDTSQCTGGGGGGTYVEFRTSRLTFDSSSSNDDAIAFIDSSACGTTLTKAGERTNAGAGANGETCNAYMAGLSYTKVTDLNLVGITVTYVSSTGNSNPSLWRLGSDPTVYAVCADNPKPVYRQFKTNICTGACTTISTNASPENPSLESTCSA